MAANFLPAIAAIQEPTLTASLLPTTAPDAATRAGGGFSSLVTDGLQEVNQKLLSTQTDLLHLASGDVSNLHQVMIRLEESKISFQLMLQVRNRLLESYQELMRMQV
jgi:flagellar hook-basal body complex protein FliE